MFNNVLVGKKTSWVRMMKQGFEENCSRTPRSGSGNGAKTRYLKVLGSISPSFYKQLLRMQIPKAHKRQSIQAFFCAFWTCQLKSCTYTRWWNWLQGFTGHPSSESRNCISYLNNGKKRNQKIKQKVEQKIKQFYLFSTLSLSLHLSRVWREQHCPNFHKARNS